MAGATNHRSGWFLAELLNMSWFPSFAGTVEAAFSIGRLIKATLSTSSLTASRTFTLPDVAGTLSLIPPTQAKSDNYTVVASDGQSLIRFSGGSYTASLTSAATLGSGFTVWLMNSAGSSSHVLTIDPDGSELVDSKATVLLYRGQAIQIMSDGTNWRIIGAIGSSRAISQNTDSSATQPNATGAESVAIGAGTTASGNYSVALGLNSSGAGGIASGISSLSLCGGEAASVNALAFGDYVTSRSTRGAKAFGNGRITTTGDAQYRHQQARGQTTNATPLVLTGDAGTASSTNIFRLPNNSTFTYRVMVTGHRTDAAGRASYMFEGCIIRDANAASTALAGTQAKTVYCESNSGYDATVTADTTNGGLIVTVTGVSGHTMTWVAHIEAAEATT